MTPLASRASGWWFFDVTVASTSPIKVTRIGGRTPYGATPGDTGTVTDMQIFKRTGSSRGNERNPAAGWVQVNSPTDNYDWEVIAVSGVNYVVVDIDDFVLSGAGANGIAVHLPDDFGVGDVQIVYDGDVVSPATPYIFPVAAMTPLITVSSATTTATFDADSLVQGYHAPNLFLEFTDPDSITISATNPLNVCAGDGTLVNFTATVSNTGFTALEPVIVTDTLTTPNNDTQYLNGITRFAVAITGCSWKIQEYATPSTGTTLQDAEDVIAASDPVPVLKPIVKARADATHGEAGDLVNSTASVVTDWTGEGANHVVQLRTSVSFATGGPYQLGFVSADFVPGTSIWFFIDNSATPLAFTIANSFIIDPALTDLDDFYTSDSNPILGNGNAFNVRVVINMPTAGTDGHYDLEIYARDTSVSGQVVMSGEALDQSWFPLQASQATPNPDVTITPNSNDLAATWTIPSLCVGGQIRLTTQLLVDSSAPDDLTITDVFHVDTTQPSGSSAIVTPASATVSPTLDVDRCSELTITKTTLCDRTELSLWQVEFWQSDAQTVGNGTSPFYDFDTTIAGSTPTNTLNVDKVDFGNANSGAFDTDGDETTFAEISGDSMMAASQFFVRARGQILVDPAGYYTFYVASNRGVRLTIDGKNASIIDEPFDVLDPVTGFRENFYTASLTAGVHNVEIVMYDTVPESILELAIAPGAEPLQSASFNGFANTPSIDAGSEELEYKLLATAPVCLLACNDDFFSGFTVNMWQWNELINVAFDNGTLIEAASPFDQFDATIQFLEPDASDCGVQFINYQSDDGNTVSGGSGPENIFAMDEEFYPLESVTTPINNFFFRATGRFFIGVAGTYTIAVNSNRGARITIDGVVRIRNEPESNGDFQRFVSLPFTAGEHTIIVDHYDSLNVARLEVGIAAGAVTSINANDPFNDDYLTFSLLGSALECQLEPQFDALETVVAGQNFTYTVTVNNNGPSDADVSVSDIVGATVVPWIVAFRTEDAGDTVANVTMTMTPTDYAWTTTIPAGESRRLFIDVAVPASVAAIDNGPMNNMGACNSATATASAGQIGTATVTTCATIIRLVDLETSIVFSDAEVTANDAADTLTATVTITNNGPSDTAGGSVPLTIVTPAGVTFTTSGTPTLTAGVLTFGALPAGSAVVLTITFDATTATAIGPITITSGDFTLSNAALERLIRTCDDEQNAAAAVIRQIDLELTKVAVTSNADNTNAVAGQDTITYTITAANNGPSTLPAGARIIDTFYGDTTGLSVNSGLTTFTPGGSYVTTLCGAVDTTTWSIQYWDVEPIDAFGGEFPFADIDRLHADNVAPTFEEERDVLSIAEDDDDIIAGFAFTRWPTAAQTGSIDFNTEETFYVTATTQLDVRSAGHFTFAANVRTGIRLSIAGGSTSTKIVLQPPFGQYQVFHTLALAVGVYDITVDYYFYTSTTQQVLQVFIADGSRFTYPAALATITPEFYRLLTPAECEFACDLAPDRDAIDTEWRTRFWAFDDSSVDNATSVFERLDQIISADATPLATAQTATVNFVRPENMVWGEPAPLAGSFFSRSVGQIWIAETGLYAFYTERPTVDLAGSRLMVDGNVLTAEVDENQPLGFNYYVIELAQGAHDVVFDAAVPCELNTGDCREIDLEIARQTTTFALVTSLSYDNLRTSTYCQVDYWVLPELAAGETATLVLVIDVGSSAVAQAPLVDTVHYPRLELPAENQLIHENDDSASASVSISRELALTIDVVATPQDVVAGSADNEVVFTVSVTNAGPSDTAGVAVRITQPSAAASVGVTQPTFTDGTDSTSQFNGTTFVWTTKVIAAGATDVLEMRYTFNRGASCDIDFPIRAEVIELIDTDGETLLSALPIEDTDAVNVIRQGTLVLSLTNNDVAVSASDDADQCSTYTASVKNNGPSDVSDASAQLALTLPLGAYVTNVVGAVVQSSGPGSVLNVALPTLERTAAATTFTFNLCASSETPDNAVIDATLSVVLLPDNLCEELTQTPADAPNVIVTREAARLAVKKTRADPGHSNGVDDFAIAGEYAGNAPYIVELSNAAVESDVDGITVETTISTTEVNAELHRVVLQPLDVGWTVEAFLPGQSDAGDLTTFPASAPFVTFIANELSYSGSVPAELAAAATMANGFYLRASAPIVIQSDAARVYTVSSTGDVELTIDGNVVVNGQSLSLTTGVHQAVVRVAQAADLGAFNLHVRAASAALLGEDLATFQAGTPSTWTIPTLRAGRTARLYEFFSALSVIAGDTGKLKNTATVNDPTSPASLNGDAGDKHTDAAQHNVHQYCVRGVDVVLELSREASVAYAGDNDFQHFVRVTNRGFVQCTGVTVDITGTSSNAGASAILLVSPQTVSLASGASVLLPVHFKIDGDADATGDVTTTAQFVAPLHAFTTNNERLAVNMPLTISTPIDRLSLVNIAVVRTTNTQSDDVANNGGANPAITYAVTFTNNGPSPARYPLVIFRCPTASPANLNAECEKIRVNRRADADKLLTVGESRTVTVEIAASDIGVGGSVFRSFFFAPKSIDGVDGTIEYSPVPIQVDTNVAPFTIGLEITAFEEIDKKRNVDAWASSSSESSSSSSSSSSSDDTETRLIFVEVHNTNAIVNAENVAVLIQFGAHDKIEHAEALLTQSSRHDSVVNNGGPSFTWTIGELAHGARARIALKLRASSHLSLSAEVVAANACLATSATCEIAADLSIENPFTKLF